MSESCKECRFFKGAVGRRTVEFNGTVLQTTIKAVCRRRHVFVPHEPTDWCGEFKCDPDFEVANDRANNELAKAASTVNTFLIRHPEIGSVCGLRLA